MNKQFIQSCLQKATYTRKPNTKTSYIWDSGFTFLPKTLSIFRGNNNVKCAKKGRNLQNAEAQLKGTFCKKEESHLKQFAPYRVSTQIWEIENYPSFIGYGSIGITGESGTITKESDTGDLIILYSKDYNWDKIEIFYFKGMLPYLEEVAEYISTVI